MELPLKPKAANLRHPSTQVSNVHMLFTPKIALKRLDLRTLEMATGSQEAVGRQPESEYLQGGTQAVCC